MMKFDPDRYHRRSIRLREYDYAQAGAYFVTIVAQGRECIFGEIIGGKMRVNQYGQVVVESWQWLPVGYPNILLDEWIVMPNHCHAILWIADLCRGASRSAPTKETRHKPLGRLIGALKTVSTKRINEIRNTPGERLWQRNYYEHIIRDERSLHEIRQYVENNPSRWSEDKENPVNVHKT